MRSIAIMNQKGGVGKTTTAVNLSAAIADQGFRVCLIDLDPQAHATLHFGIEPQVDFDSIYNVLIDGLSLAAVRRQISEHLFVVPSHLDLSGAEIELPGIPGREFILREKILEDDTEFDYVIIDCPPSLGTLTLNALTAVKEVFIPLQPHFLALHGLSKLLQTVELVNKRLNNELELRGVLLCMYEAGTRLAQEVAQDVQTFFTHASSRNTPWSGATVFETKIRRNIKLAEAPSHGKPIFEYDPNSKGAEDYRQLAEELLGERVEV